MWRFRGNSITEKIIKIMGPHVSYTKRKLEMLGPKWTPHPSPFSLFFPFPSHSLFSSRERRSGRASGRRSSNRRPRRGGALAAAFPLRRWPSRGSWTNTVDNSAGDGSLNRGRGGAAVAGAGVVGAAAGVVVVGAGWWVPQRGPVWRGWSAGSRRPPSPWTPASSTCSSSAAMRRPRCAHARGRTT